MTNRLRGPALFAVLAAIALPAAGCGGDGEDQAEAGNETQETETAGTSTEEAASTVAEPEELSAEGIVSGEGSIDGHPIRFELTQLERSGDTVEAAARVELLSGEEDASLQVSESFSDGQYQQLTTGESEESFVFDGISLIDPDARKKYLVARDETGRCVCSNQLSSVFIYPGTPVMLQATLAAPPEEVENVDVSVPTIRTFTDVPLSAE